MPPAAPKRPIVAGESASSASRLPSPTTPERSDGSFSIASIAASSAARSRSRASRASPVASFDPSSRATTSLRTTSPRTCCSAAMRARQEARRSAPEVPSRWRSLGSSPRSSSPSTRTSRLPRAGTASPSTGRTAGRGAQASISVGTGAAPPGAGPASRVISARRHRCSKR